ncbi:MAG: hypothetical protein SGJ09_16690 [Phycisphaerae bacterium]|nr:hypothetical protein [Phycisphaerae bacterium]
MPERLASYLAALVASFFFLFGPAAATASGDDVTIELVSMGVGNVARPGDWVGIKVGLTSALTDAITTEVSWEVANADGDICENTRTVTLAPGQKVKLWIYGRLPPSAQPVDLVNAPYSIRVFETVGGRRGRELGATRISGQTAATPPGAVEMDQDLILVLGERRLGLEQYRDNPLTGYVAPPGVQCRTILSSGINVADLPDRWEGLSPFSTIVWCDAERKPSQLKGEQAKALREWIWRGGTLVIGLASAPDAWGVGRPGTHELQDLLPTESPTRQELLITELLPILSKYQTVRDSSRITPVWTWDVKTLDRGFTPLVALPSEKTETTGFLANLKSRPYSGAVVGIQRSYGFGFIVVLGIDVDEIYTRGLHVNAPVPQADIFWNRVLGRRGDTPTGEESLRYAEASTQILTNVGGFSSMLGEGALISQQIGMPGQAAIGVLAAAGLFIAYWILSGPLGFMSLRQFKRERHSWLLFVGVAFLFTAVAWAGGSLLASTRASLKHVTVLDQLAFDPANPDSTQGIPEQRATSWMSVYLPSYGPTPLAIGDGKPGSTDLLGSWSPPPSGTGDTFPNRDRYRVDADGQSNYRVPARKTSADFVAQWRGIVDPKWGSPVSLVSPSNPVRINFDRSVKPNTIQIVGALKHGLPGTLEQVRVILVSPYRTPLAGMDRTLMPLPLTTTSGQLPLYGVMKSPAKGTWAPGVALNLPDIFGDAIPAERDGTAGALRREFDSLYYSEIAQDISKQLGFGDALTPERRRTFMEMLSFYWMLEPPRWFKKNVGEQTVLARAGRLMGRGIDLSPWFTRPCLIITGFLENSPCPVPISVDGEPVAGSGVTMFRWIYPLDVPSEFAVPTIATPEIAAPAATPPTPSTP